MATVSQRSTDPLAVAGWSEGVDPESKSDRYLSKRLAAAGSDYKGVAITTFLLAAGVGVLLWLACGILVEHWGVPGGLPAWARWAWLAAGLLVFVMAVGRWIVPLVRYRLNLVYAARILEREHPELHNDVVNAVLARAHADDTASLVVKSLRRRAARQLSSVSADGVIDRTPALRLAYLLAGLLALACIYEALAPKSFVVSAARLVAPWLGIAPPSRVRIAPPELAWRMPGEPAPADLSARKLPVQGGAVTLIRGRQLVVACDVRGLAAEERPMLVVTPVRDDGSAEPATAAWRMPMASGGVNGVHSVLLPDASRGLDRPLELVISAGDARSPRIRVVVVDAPALLVREVRYDYPEYTGQADETVEWQGDLRAVEGTKVTIVAECNHPLESAWIDLGCEGKRKVPLAVGQQDLARVRGSFTLNLDADRSAAEYPCYRLMFQQKSAVSAGREPVTAEKMEYRIDVEPDLAPEVSIEEPAEKVVRVPPSAPVTIRVRGEDPDFGLASVTVETRIAKGGEKPGEELLVGRRRKVFRGAATLIPERLGAGEGAVLEYRAVVKDTRPETPNIAVTEWRALKIDASAPPQEPPPAAGEREPQPDGEQGQPEESEAGGMPPEDGGDGESDAGGAGDDTAEGKRGDQAGERQGESQGAGSDAGEQGSGKDGSQQGDPSGDQKSGDQKSGDKQQGDAGGNGGGKKDAGGGQSQPQEGSQQQGGKDGESGRKDEQQSKSQRQQDPKQGGKQGDPQEGKEQGGGDGGKTQDGAEGKSGDQQGPRQQTGGRDGDGSEPQGQGGGQQPQGGRAGEQNNGGEGGEQKPSGAGQQAGERDGQSQPGGQQSGDQQKGGQQPGQKGGDSKHPGKNGGQGKPSPKDTVAADGTDDGEAMERILQHRQQSKPGQGEGQSSEQGKSEQGESGKGESGKGESGKGESGKGEQSAGAESQGQQGEGEGEGTGQGQPREGQGSEGQPQSGAGKPGAGPEGNQPQSPEKSGAGQQGDQNNPAAAGEQASKDGNKRGEGPGAEPAGEAAGKPGQQPGQQPGQTAGQGKEQGSGEAGQPGEGSQAAAGSRSGDGGWAGRRDATAGGERRDRDMEWGEQDLANARNAADLAIEHLRQSVDSGDTTVLDELGWTPQQARDFLARWEAMQRMARNGDARQRGEFEQAVRSLGLRPGGVRSNRDVPSDVKGGQAEGRRSRPPTDYREQFKAFMQGAAAE